MRIVESRRGKNLEKEDRNLRKLKYEKDNNKYIRSFLLSSFALLVFINTVSAAPVVRQGSGVSAAALQSIVDQFRTDLGGANNGVGGSFISGRREVNWDGVPDNFSEPNNLPVDFFNVNSPRGIDP